MKDTTIEKYIIAYSNSFVFEGQTFSFRKKELFNITGVPKIIKRSNQGWWIGRVLLTFKMIQLRRIGNYQVTLMKSIFGVYLCRIWYGFDYEEYQSRNKFTAYRRALRKMKKRIKLDI